ncbi:hypothetical protein DM02DRAFT_619330 [Periconia macrospinosa]|uniref:Uncharacterized protein n=1 Tax=Periconia macrospinosa TaxID=97972 RepID=A0A2V1D5L0_9PLEO|nr:hypothetical protein DM02DRAFT_619330 [Periconia macrospinosa]
MLGLWSLLRNYFIPQTLPFRYLESISASEETTLTLPSLLKNSKLLPSPKTASTTPTLIPTSLPATSSSQAIHSSLVESLAISPTHLNAYTLSTYAQTPILWTSNISRHLLLSQHEGKPFLEVFALPCVLSGRSPDSLEKIGLSSALCYEIRDSYSLLFNPDGGDGEGFVHQRWGALRWWSLSLTRLSRPKEKKDQEKEEEEGSFMKYATIHWICPCRSCSSFRLLRREISSLKNNVHHGTTANVVPWEPAHFGFDPMVEELARKKVASTGGGGWSQTRFPHLWERIVKCDRHLREARPWSFWVLFRDRRDTLQFWTFLFGSLILILTMMQVALGIAQVVGAF